MNKNYWIFQPIYLLKVDIGCFPMEVLLQVSPIIHPFIIRDCLATTVMYQKIF